MGSDHAERRASTPRDGLALLTSPTFVIPSRPQPKAKASEESAFAGITNDPSLRSGRQTWVVLGDVNRARWFHKWVLGRARPPNHRFERRRAPGISRHAYNECAVRSRSAELNLRAVEGG